MKTPVFFFGIGGIGMSALARWYRAHGHEVAGYDRTATPLTEALQREGIPVDTTGQREALPDGLLRAMEDGVPDRWKVVRTPAVPDEFPLLKEVKTAGFRLWKRAEILGQIAAGRRLFAVAGTHGKTTTSTILAHLLHHAGLPTEAFLGGIAKSTGSNLLLAPQGSTDPWMVAEADEFDRSFLTLHPQHAVITSADADHLDVYGDHASLVSTFLDFAEQVDTGRLLIHQDAWRALSEHPERTLPPHTRYGHFGPADATQGALPHAWEGGYGDVSHQEKCTEFVLCLQGQAPQRIRWCMPGEHNAANATAAAILASRAGLAPSDIASGLASFPGIARRFDIRHSSPQLTVIDDYAHHPTEIAGTIAAARLAHPNKRLVGVFQPHLYSRTKDFLDGFAKALSLLDHALILPIYAARETPVPGVDAQAIGDKVNGCPADCPDEKRFLEVLERSAPEVLLFMGAGDLHQWIPAAIDRIDRPAAPAHHSMSHP